MDVTEAYIDEMTCADDSTHPLLSRIWNITLTRAIE